MCRHFMLTTYPAQADPNEKKEGKKKGTSYGVWDLRTARTKVMRHHQHSDRNDKALRLASTCLARLRTQPLPLIQLHVVTQQ